MELWRHTKRIVESPVDIVDAVWNLIRTGKWNDKDEAVRYFGIFLIIASVLIALVQ